MQQTYVEIREFQHFINMHDSWAPELLCTADVSFALSHVVISLQ